MRVSEEPADHVRKLLQSTQSANGLGLEIIFAHDDPATDPIVLHVVPNPFIRVQIWRVRRQVKYFQASVCLVLGELFDLLCPVDRVAVNDEENPVWDAVKQRFEEIDETAGVHAAFLHAETQFPARRYRRHHAYRFPFAGLYYDRGLPDRAPRGPGVVIGSQTGLILEEDAGALLRGELADLRVYDFLPFLHALWILLVRAVKRPLRRQAHLL